MKAVRIIWFSLMPCLFLAARYTGRRELFVLLFIQLFVTLLTLALNLWTVFSFSFIQELPHKTRTKGQPGTLVVQIYNDKPFPFTRMQIQVETPTLSQKVRLLFTLPSSSHIDFEVPLQSSYRGVYDVGMSLIDVHDIFGLLRTRFDMRRLPYYRTVKLTVYPQLVALPFLPARNPETRHLGGLYRPADEGDAYADLRAYRPGDPLKRVHKVASARKRELLVKRYDLPMESAVLVALDTSPPPIEGEEGLYLADLACECAAAIAYSSLRHGNMVVALQNDRSYPALTLRSTRDYPKLNDMLATAPYTAKDDIVLRLTEQARRNPNLEALYIISPHPPGRYASQLELLARPSIRVNYLLVQSGRTNTNTARPSEVLLTTIALGDDVAGTLGAFG